MTSVNVDFVYSSLGIEHDGVSEEEIHNIIKDVINNPKKYGLETTNDMFKSDSVHEYMMSTKGLNFMKEILIKNEKSKNAWKFENIQVGDTVFVETPVRISYSSNIWFFIPTTVIKTTKTQFTTKDGRRFKKMNGSEIGNASTLAYNVGDKIKKYTKDGTQEELITDQTELMNEMIKKIKIRKFVNNKITNNVSVDNKNLEKIYNALVEIDKLIKSGEE
jgi:hypothetical protein